MPNFVKLDVESIVRSTIRTLDEQEIDAAVQFYGADGIDVVVADWAAWLYSAVEERARKEAARVFPLGQDAGQERVAAHQYAWAQSMLRQARDLTVGAACVLVEVDGQYLAVCDEGGRPLGFPGGKREPGETPSQTAVRELREETGLDVCEDDLARICVGPAGGIQCAGFFLTLPERPVDLLPEPGRTVAFVAPAALLGPDARFAAWNQAALEEVNR